MAQDFKLPVKLGFSLLGIFVAMQMPAIAGADAGANTSGGPSAAWKTAATTCAEQSGFTLPDSPDGFHQLAPELKDAFHQCMDAAGFRTPPHPHPPLSAAMISCLTAAGFPPPQGGAAGGPPQSPPSQPSSEMHAAFEQCKAQTNSN